MQLKDSGLSYGTVQCYKRMLKPVFKMALHDDYIRKNPFDFVLSSIMKNDTKSTQALTQEQEQKLLTFMKVSAT